MQTESQQSKITFNDFPHVPRAMRRRPSRSRSASLIEEIKSQKIAQNGSVRGGPCPRVGAIKIK